MSAVPQVKLTAEPMRCQRTMAYLRAYPNNSPEQLNAIQASDR